MSVKMIMVLVTSSIPCIENFFAAPFSIDVYLHNGILNTPSLDRITDVANSLNVVK
jgi:hypothetical protein